MRARWTRTARAGAGLAAVVSLAACGIGNAATGSVATKSSLTVGVYSDRPGLSLRDSTGTYRGFDIDIATYVARRLGVTGDHLHFKEVNVAQRQTFLLDGGVDMVVATFSITPERLAKLGFAGPYYIAHQDILVRTDDTSVHDVRDLKGKRLCGVAGSVSGDRITKQRKIAARLVPSPGYGECVRKLLDGSIDVVSTDDMILAGYAAQQGGRLRMVNAPFSDEPMGIGLPKNDVAGCEAINKAITQMYQDGTAAKILQRWFAASGLHLTTTVPQFQGCGS
jgi:glutamate transport system substrate-binding protein